MLEIDNTVPDGHWGWNDDGILQSLDYVTSQWIRNTVDNLNRISMNIDTFNKLKRWSDICSCSYPTSYGLCSCGAVK